MKPRAAETGSFDHHDADMFLAYDGKPPNFEETDSPKDAELIAAVRDAVAGRRVLEIACGGGNWARKIQDVVTSYTGIDISPRRIAFARERFSRSSKLQFKVGDAYRLDEVAGDFDAALAIAWFSHVPRARHAEFFRALQRRLLPSAPILLADEAANDPNAFKIGNDCYKRGTREGKTYEIVDNAFSDEDYREIFSQHAAQLKLGRSAVWSWVRFE